MYDTVYRAQRASIEKVKDGAKSVDVYNASNNIIEKELGQKLIHSIGHGLGIEVHDFPSRMGANGVALKENMCITVEPGYYKDVGVRIEDDVVVTKTGCRMLSDAPDHLVEI